MSLSLAFLSIREIFLLGFFIFDISDNAFFALLSLRLYETHAGFGLRSVVPDNQIESFGRPRDVGVQSPGG
jgi:hypothetical protein